MTINALSAILVFRALQIAMLTFFYKNVQEDIIMAQIVQTNIMPT